MSNSGERSVVERPLVVRVGIPHFCRIGAGSDGGYGSSRDDALLQRAAALSRCLGGVLSLARAAEEEILGIADANLLQAPALQSPGQQASGLAIDCHLFVTGDDYLKDVLTAFQRRITVHQLELNDPRRLPFVVRDFLLNDEGGGSADLSVYLEDDLVIQDRLYMDKLLWFYKQTAHQFALMPHRFELTGYHLKPRLFVDGPIDPDVLPDHQKPCEEVCSGRFAGQVKIAFERASNPHSGSFSCSAIQRQRILEAGVADEGFVGPLETVATHTVLQHLPVLKPGWSHRDFLCFEHAHPSFLAARHQIAKRA